MFDVNHSHILQYFTSVWYQVIFFSHNTYFKELPIELRINSYRIGSIFATVPEN